MLNKEPHRQLSANMKISDKQQTTCIPYNLLTTRNLTQIVTKKT